MIGLSLISHYRGVVPAQRSHLGTQPFPDPFHGEMRLTGAQPRSGSRWTLRRTSRAGPLKHRARGDARRVPIHRELVMMLRRLGHARVHRPWVTEPGMWLQYDFGDGPVVDGVKTVLFVA